MLKSYQRATSTFTTLLLLMVIISLNKNNFVSSQITSNNAEQVPFTSNNKVKRLTVPLDGNLNVWTQHQPTYYDIRYVRTPLDYFSSYRSYLFTGWPDYPHLQRRVPHWQAASKLTGEGIDGMIVFQPLPFSSNIRVILNATGLPPGRHALHIHTYGDISDGCQSTGEQFPNNFLGNVDAKEDGSISIAFISAFLNLFGFHGIVGRSIVIHEKPIDLNTVLNAEIISSTLPDVFASQNEEKSVGAAIACGIISIQQQQQQQQRSEQK
uniref:superoxide dismutase n=1 Tax=Glossina brevipalpis TaxID=37001 RepID=A0A1A9W8A6_9MUSC